MVHSREYDWVYLRLRIMNVSEVNEKYIHQKTNEKRVKISNEKNRGVLENVDVLIVVYDKLMNIQSMCTLSRLPCINSLLSIPPKSKLELHKNHFIVKNSLCYKS